MATIYPFIPMRPNPVFAGHLVLAKPQAESISGDCLKPGGLQPLKNLLELPARLRPETEKGQIKAYAEINARLESLLKREQLWFDLRPGIYIYEVSHNGYSQNGIWCLTDVDDYKNGHIKIHELTLADSVRRLHNYRRHTGLEGSPVLLTYQPVPEIADIIVAVKKGAPAAVFGNAEGFHKLWLITDPGLMKRLQLLFKKIPATYLADGHHRMEAAGQSYRSPGTETISTLYMAADELRVEAYHRVVMPNEPVSKESLLSELSKNFYLRESTGNHMVLPDAPHCLGMYIMGEWYHLRAKAHTYINRRDAEALDAALLQECVLNELFGIDDPKTDSRLAHAGGPKAMQEIGSIIAEHPDAVVFTLAPLTVADMVEAAEGGYVLPPKSTWVIPKVPYGLLIQKHSLV